MQCIAACLTDASLGCSECNQLAPERCGACLDPSGVIDGSGKCRPQTCQEKFPTCGKCDVTGSYCVVCKRGCKCRSRPEWEHGGQYPGHDYKPYNPQPWKPAPQKPGHEYKPPLTWQHKPQQPGHDYNPHPIKASAAAARSTRSAAQHERPRRLFAVAACAAAAAGLPSKLFCRPVPPLLTASAVAPGPAAPREGL